MDGLSVDRVRRLRDAAALESPAQTAIFWGVTGVYSLCFLLVRFPPCVDYPQHLALATLLGNLLDPNAAEHAAFEAQWLTYNGLFHACVALLSRALPAELAGRAVLASVPILIACASLSLMRYAKRPLWYATLILPMSYSFAMGWGFVNYCLAAPLAIWTLVEWLRHLNGERRAGRVIAGSLLVAYAHGLTLAAFVLSAAVAFLARSTIRERAGLGPWLRDAARGVAVLLPALAYTVAVFGVHTSAPHIAWQPKSDGSDLPVWQKLALLPQLTLGNLGDHSDLTLFLALAAVVLVLCLRAYARGSEGPAAPRECKALCAFWAIGYLLVPQVLFSTAFLFERIPIWIWAFLVSITPRAPRGPFDQARALGLALAALLSVNTARAFSALPYSREASAILDAIPENSRVLALTYAQRPLPAVDRPVWVHHSAYYLVRKRGELAFDFTRYASLPLRARDGDTRPRLPSGVEWDPSQYTPGAPYARYYDTLLVTTDGAPNPDLMHATSGFDLVTERGPFRIYRRRSARSTFDRP